MASVVADPGSFRVPTRMFEAMCERRFSVGEMRIVLTVLRLFQDGKRDRTIRISHADLARETGMRFSGAFVRALRQLIARGVVVIVEKGSGRRPPRYVLCGRPELWRAVGQSDFGDGIGVESPTATDSPQRAPTRPTALGWRCERYTTAMWNSKNWAGNFLTPNSEVRSCTSV